MKNANYLECTKVTPSPGYLAGMRQASLIVDVSLNNLLNQNNLKKKNINEAFFDIHPELISASIPKELEFVPSIFYLGEIVAFILTTSGIPVFNKYLILSNQNNKLITLALPTVHFAYPGTREALFWAIEFINRIIQGDPTNNLLNQLKEIKTRINKTAPTGHNSIYFIKAAHEAGIPWSRVVGNIFQFGWGSKAKWLDSSFTDETSNIAARMCRNKLWCSSVLKASGLPTAEHYVARSPEKAISAARKIGYPVVIKPVALDGGKGVFADINSELLLRKYFNITFKISKDILVEKHIDGDDFRLQVYKDEIFWAVKRVPASVLGDGINSVEKLIILKKEKSIFFAKYLIEQQAFDYLTEQNFTLNYIPKKNELIKLARRANVSSGGSSESILEDIHPDNRLLAIRAARAVGLDLAGVDIIMRDIKKSWLEIGAAILEVNAQPQIAPEGISKLTTKLVKDNGRIPIVVIIGSGKEEKWIKDAILSLKKSGNRLGVAVNNQLLIDGDVIGKSTNFYEASRVLLNDKKVDMAIICMSDYSFENGLPFDRIDKLILTDSDIKINNLELIRKSSYLIFSKITNHILVKEGSYFSVQFLEEEQCKFDIQSESDLMLNISSIGSYTHET